MNARLMPELETAPGRYPMRTVLTALAITYLPQILHFNPLLSIALYSVLAWRWFAIERNWPMPNRAVRVLMALTGFAAVLVLYRTINGPEAGLALLAVMITLKLTEAQRVKDALLIVVLGYFVVFASFLYSQEILHVALQLPSLLFLTAALLALGHNHDVSNTRQSLRHAAVLTLQAIPFVIILFFLFPRLPGPLWGVPTAGASAVSGLSDNMSPGDITNLVMSDKVVFRVKFENEIPPTPSLYWRGPTLHLFNGRTWWQGFASFADTERYEAIGNPVRYEVMLEPHEQAWLFSLEVPVIYPRDAILTRDFMLVSRRNIVQRKQYQVTSYLDHVMSREITSLERNWGLQMPGDYNPQTRELAAQWRSEGLDDRQIVARSLRLFREQPFEYTLQPPPLRGHTVDEFLFSTQSGFCEHYASAFTFLMRAAGIPSRVVTGYQGGEYNEVSGFVVVRSSDAHAWSEVWLEGEGWTRVDPTAAVSPDRINLGITAALSGDEGLPAHLRGISGLQLLAQLEIGWEAINSLWFEFFLGYGPELQQSFMKWLGMEDPDWSSLTIWMLVLLGVAGAGLSAYLYLRYRKPQPDKAQQLYLRLRRRLNPAASMAIGPRDFIRQQVLAHPEKQRQLLRFLDLYLKVRYQDRSDSLQELRQSYRILRN